MERLTKKQKEILKYLKAFLMGITYSEVIKIFKNIDERTEIKILVENGLIKLNNTNGELYRPQGTRYPTSILLTITPKGIEKLRETFITRLEDTAWKNPWVVIAIIISLVSIGANWYVSHTTEKIQVELNEVKGKIAQYDTLVIKNITADTLSDKIYFQCPNGTIMSNLTWGKDGFIMNCIKI